MDEHGAGPGNDLECSEAVTRRVMLSRREFARRAGLGTTAAVGLVWAAPKISTVVSIHQAAAGSPPPGGSTVAPTVASLGGRLSLSATDPCVGGTVHLSGVGFAPNTGVAVELDSPANPIGLTRADSDGSIDATVTIPRTGLTGARTLRAHGVQVGGASLVLSAPITIKTVAECEADVGTEGNRTSPEQTGTDNGNSGDSLPFTGGNVTDLALLGGAAVIGGRAIYGAAKRPSRDVDEG